MKEEIMKTKLLLVGSCLFLVVTMLTAQRPGSKPDPLGGNLFPPELIMKNQRAIGLEVAQRDTIRAEIQEAQQKFTELQWEMQDAAEVMMSLVSQDRVNEQQALAQLDKVLSIEREVKRAQIQLMVRLKNQLTPEQQKQLKELRPEAGR
jgi:Spy/CpxP family protein refolding chaperone